MSVHTHTQRDLETLRLGALQKLQNCVDDSSLWAVGRLPGAPNIAHPETLNPGWERV